MQDHYLHYLNKRTYFHPETCGLGCPFTPTAPAPVPPPAGLPPWIGTPSPPSLPCGGVTGGVLPDPPEPLPDGVPPAIPAPPPPEPSFPFKATGPGPLG